MIKRWVLLAASDGSLFTSTAFNDFPDKWFVMHGKVCLLCMSWNVFLCLIFRFNIKWQAYVKNWSHPRVYCSVINQTYKCVEPYSQIHKLKSSLKAMHHVPSFAIGECFCIKNGSKPRAQVLSIPQNTWYLSALFNQELQKFHTDTHMYIAVFHNFIYTVLF